MRTPIITIGLVGVGLFLSSLVYGEAGKIAELQALNLGRKIYREACEPCHGIRGDGKGPEARGLSAHPGVFTQGQFKFRTTVEGALPTDDDLIRTVSEGINGTFMPSWKNILGEEEIRAVVQYIKTFNPRFEKEHPEDQRIIPPEAELTIPKSSPEMIARGREIYQMLECANCHGDSGKGDGPDAEGLTDDLGQPIHPANLRKGIFKGGNRPYDIYRTLLTGLNGTPMYPFAENLEDKRDVWTLVYYILSLSKQSP